jgi:hypothetical protein
MKVYKFRCAKPGLIVITSPRLPFLLYRWKDWESLEAPKQWILLKKYLGQSDRLQGLPSVLPSSHVAGSPDTQPGARSFPIMRAGDLRTN